METPKDFGKIQLVKDRQTDAGDTPSAIHGKPKGSKRKKTGKQKEPKIKKKKRKKSQQRIKKKRKKNEQRLVEIDQTGQLIRKEKKRNPKKQPPLMIEKDRIRISPQQIR